MAELLDFLEVQSTEKVAARIEPRPAPRQKQNAKKPGQQSPRVMVAVEQPKQNFMSEIQSRIHGRCGENVSTSGSGINRVIYGQAASPYLSVKAMQQCAIDYSNGFPIGAKTLTEDFYVDDGLSGGDSDKKALQKARN